MPCSNERGIFHKKRAACASYITKILNLGFYLAKQAHKEYNIRVYL